MDIKEIISKLKEHFKEQYAICQEDKKIGQHNHKFYVQAEKDAQQEVNELHANKHEYEKYLLFVQIKDKKIQTLKPLLKDYKNFTRDSNKFLTIKHIIYNRLRNKKRGHTHDDQKFINAHKAVASVICERMGVQPSILEAHYKQSEISI